MPPWDREVYGRDFVFMKYNAPPHVAHGTVAFLDQHGVKVMDWLAVSSDMNPIEHVEDQI